MLYDESWERKSWPRQPKPFWRDSIFWLKSLVGGCSGATLGGVLMLFGAPWVVVLTGAVFGAFALNAFAQKWD